MILLTSTIVSTVYIYSYIYIYIYIYIHMYLCMRIYLLLVCEVPAYACLMCTWEDQCWPHSRKTRWLQMEYTRGWLLGPLLSHFRPISVPPQLPPGESTFSIIVSFAVSSNLLSPNSPCSSYFFSASSRISMSGKTTHWYHKHTYSFRVVPSLTLWESAVLVNSLISWFMMHACWNKDTSMGICIVYS